MQIHLVMRRIEDRRAAHTGGAKGRRLHAKGRDWVERITCVHACACLCACICVCARAGACLGQHEDTMEL